MRKKQSMPTDKELRSYGYMTSDEFVVKFAFGLKEYLHTNWLSPKDIHHPEDLASNALSYAEAVFQVIGIFGVGNTNEDNK